MIARIFMAGLMALSAGCTRTDASEAPSPGGGRIRSTLGFSLLPPPGKDWTEEFSNDKHEFSKKTDPSVVTFLAGAMDVKLHTPLPDREAMAAFVRAKKDDWGTDSRYSDVSTSFLPDAQLPSCVRYRMTVHDHGAHNRGNHAFLSMHIAGRFCTHPQNPNAAVDIFYSTRQIPEYDANDLHAEGEAFIDSLAFETPRSPSTAGDR
jgi:hypothetical protein